MPVAEIAQLLLRLAALAGIFAARRKAAAGLTALMAFMLPLSLYIYIRSE